LWIFVDLCGYLWIDGDICGQLEESRVDLCGYLWIFVDICGYLWIFVDIASSLIYMLVGLSYMELSACSQANNSLARILKCALDSPQYDLFKYAIKIAVVILFNYKFN
jgi:hypothetical protein